MFWECPVARAVMQSLTAQTPDITYQLPHLWLLQTPDGSIDRAVWAVVGLSALAAMDTGRKVLYQLVKSAQQQDQPVLLQPDSNFVQQASTAAIQRLWALLTRFAASFAGSSSRNEEYAFQLRHDHPWLKPRSSIINPLQVVLPQDLVLPPEVLLWKDGFD
jgi:hypothetical protein